MIPFGFASGDKLHVYREDGTAGTFVVRGDTQTGMDVSFEGYEPARHAINVSEAVSAAPLDVGERLSNLTTLIKAATRDRLSAMNEARNDGMTYSEIGRRTEMTGVGAKGILDREFPPPVITRIKSEPQVTDPEPAGWVVSVGSTVEVSQHQESDVEPGSEFDGPLVVA